MPASSRHPGLDGLRGLAFLGVLLFHDAWLGIGWAGVPLFFLVSGVLIRGSLARTPGTGARRLWGFAVKRLARLGPLYVPWMLGALALRQLSGESTSGVSVLGLATGTLNWTRAVAPLDDPALTHLWSLSAEEQCYALAAIGVAFGAGRRSLAALVVAASALRLGLWLALSTTEPYLRADAVYQLTHVDLFAVGVALAAAPDALARWRWPATASTGAVLTVLLLLEPPTTPWQLTSLGLPFAGISHGQPLWQQPLLTLLLAPWVAQVMVCPPSWTTLPALRHLGRRCYALYVLHWSVLTTLDTALGVAHPTELPWPLAIAKLALALALLLVLAELSWRWLERPADRWLRQRLAAGA